MGTSDPLGLAKFGMVYRKKEYYNFLLLLGLALVSSSGGADSFLFCAGTVGPSVTLGVIMGRLLSLSRVSPGLGLGSAASANCKCKEKTNMEF